MSNAFSPSRFLRLALAADAVASGATGTLMAAASSPLSGILGLPEPLLRYAGLALLPFALFVGWLARSATVNRAAVWTVIVINAAWVVDSALLLASGWVAPTTLGYAFVIFQAVVVLALAEAQFVGLRRDRPASMMPA